MDIESEKKLAEIVAKEPGALTESEIEFLRARRPYLSEEQRAIFKDFLTEPESEEKTKKEKTKKEE